MIDITGAGDNLQMWEMRLHQFTQLQIGLRIVNGVNQYLRLRRSGRFQQIHTRRVAIKNLHAEFTQRFDMIGVVIEHHHLHPARQQQTPGYLTKSPKPGHNDPRLLFIDFIRLARFTRRGLLHARQ